MNATEIAKMLVYGPSELARAESCGKDIKHYIDMILFTEDENELPANLERLSRFLSSLAEFCKGGRVPCAGDAERFYFEAKENPAR